jgi:hypothetical protein
MLKSRAEGGAAGAFAAKGYLKRVCYGRTARRRITLKKHGTSIRDDSIPGRTVVYKNEIITVHQCLNIIRVIFNSQPLERKWISNIERVSRCPHIELKGVDDRAVNLDSGRRRRGKARGGRRYGIPAPVCGVVKIPVVGRTCISLSVSRWNSEAESHGRRGSQEAGAEFRRVARDARRRCRIRLRNGGLHDAASFVKPHHRSHRRTSPSPN